MTLLALVQAAHATDLQQAHADAAREFGVPETLLLAISYEASHWRPEVTSQWGGYGLFDLREPDEVCTDSSGCGPDLEQAARLLGISPDRLIADPIDNIRGGAALLAWHARRMPDGVLPDHREPVDWWDAVRAFSGRHDPELQELYAGYVYELLNDGVLGEPGLVLLPEPIDEGSRVPPAPPSSSCDFGGCARFSPASPANYSPSDRIGSDIDRVVVHTVQGSYSGCIAWFRNADAGVSAHYVVRSSDGEVTQMVRERDVAWHAGNWDYNLRSVGIEHEGYVEAPATYYTDAMYAGSAALTADILARTDVAPSRHAIVGHAEVPGATHSDPGPGWDWDLYMSLVGSGEVTGDLVGVVADGDIYNGIRLVGATAWIDETGETTRSDGDGAFRFADLPLGTYTVRALADGYDAGACTKRLTSGENWCSIALTPSADVGDSGGGGADAGDSGGEGDGGEGDDGGGAPTGDRPTPTDHPGACRGCAVSPGDPAALLLILALAVAGRTRDIDPR